MCSDEGNLAFLKKETTLLPAVDVQTDNSNELLDQWYKLIDEYRNHFGTTRDYDTMIRKKEKYFKSLTKYIRTSDRFLLNKIALYKHELDTFDQDPENVNQWDSLSALELNFKIDMPERTTSVFKYYSRLKTANALNERINKQIDGGKKD